MHNACDGDEWDCTRWAKELRAVGNDGDIYRIENPDGVLENGRGWFYHDVLYNPEADQLFDPMSRDFAGEERDTYTFSEWIQIFGPNSGGYTFGISPAN